MPWLSAQHRKRSQLGFNLPTDLKAECPLLLLMYKCLKQSMGPIALQSDRDIKLIKVWVHQTLIKGSNKLSGPFQLYFKNYMKSAKIFQQ